MDTPASAAPAASDSSLSASSPESSEVSENLEETLAPEEEAELAQEEESAKKAESSKDAKEATKELKKKLKLKIDGKELEEELDFNNDEQLKKYLQKAKAFDKRSQEFASYQKQVDDFIKKLQTSPEEIMEKMGFNLDEFAEKRLQRKIEEMSKSPEEIEKEKMRQELEALRKQKEEMEQQRKTAEMEALKNQAAAEIEKDIEDALGTAKSILPAKNPEILSRIARTMLFAMQNGYPQVSAKEVIPIVEKQYKEELQNLFSAHTEDVLEDIIGKTNLDRLRKRRLAAMRSTKTQTAKQVVQDTGITKEAEESKGNGKRLKDWMWED